MLYLIKGRAGSGKTQKLRETVKELAFSGISKPLMLVPEQFSFETERTLLKLLGARTAQTIDIYSFPRMALSYLSALPRFSNLKLPDNGVKTALMSETLEQLNGELNIFSDLRHTPSALTPIVDFCKELKYCRIDSKSLNEKLSLMPQCFLKEKLKELDLISSSYNALLTQSYFDDTDSVTVFTEKAAQTGYFNGKTLFLDGFRTFSKQELECLQVALSQADDVYITICTDETRLKFSPFSYMEKIENRLRALANEVGVSVREMFCSQLPDSFSGDIYKIEKSLYGNFQKTEKAQSDKSVKVVSCIDSEDECKFIACTVRKLLRTGEYRCRDIAVIERTGGTYKGGIVDELKRLGVPVFDDSRRPLVNETLFVYVCAALECITSGFKTESFMRYLKTGLTSLTLTEISKLEKYALVWGITGTAWQKDFTMNPDGFGNAFDEKTSELLEQLNSIRKKAVVPLLTLKKNCENADGKTVAAALYEFINSEKVRDRLYELTVSLDENGFSVEADRQEASWDILMHIIDTAALLTKDKYYPLKRWYELFMILVSSGDIGEIPQGLDEVTVGCADRIRIEKIKVAFLVGVNKDEFPLVNVQDGILTETDRIKLLENGIEVRPPFETAAEEERFISYCAVTAASDKLYLTYKNSDLSGAAVQKSEIIDCVYDCLEDVDTIVTSQLPEDYFFESDEYVFSALAKNFNVNNSLKSTLGCYFSANENYKGKILALQTVSGTKPFAFENAETAEKLFGKDIFISASKVENFYNCPFAYFMRYGLGAQPLEPATLDPAQSGTLIHLVMEKVLKKYPDSRFLNEPIENIKSTVSEILNGYLEEKMGGSAAKTKRFMFLFNRLVDISMTVILRLRAEFGVGSFVPSDFELKIGGEQIPAYELPLDSGSVKVTGSVDRVDLYEKDGIKYIRVVDYKTGKKEFKLSELFDGLNIQMVLYLMALEKNGKSYYGDFLPAGVLYLPSRIGVGNYLDLRSPAPEEVSAQKRLSGKLSGMILESPVVFKGMGVDAIDGYFPVSIKSDGSPSGNYYTLSHFKKLSELIDSKIISMGNALHKGEIAAIPCGSDDKGKMCAYCSYKAVCMRESTGAVSQITKLTHAKALEQLAGDENV